jgi:FkbM family methyltransferase
MSINITSLKTWSTDKAIAFLKCYPAIWASLQRKIDDRYYYSEQLLIQGRYRKAENILRNIVNKAPKAAQSVYLLGISLLLQHRFDDARKYIDAAFDIKPWLRDIPTGTLDLIPILKEIINNNIDWPWAQYHYEREAYHSLNFDLATVANTILSTSDTFFIQIGANDGVSGDPIREYVLKYQWRGILMEPLPEPFSLLRANYSNNRHLFLENAAISDENGTGTIYIDTTDRTPLASVTPGRNALSKRRILDEVTVSCLTVNTLLKKYKVNKIDLIQIDVEGYDYKVLSQFDLDKYSTKAINMEFYCLPITERLKTFALLNSKDFIWKVGKMDLLAIKTDYFPKVLQSS